MTIRKWDSPAALRGGAGHDSMAETRVAAKDAGGVVSHPAARAIRGPAQRAGEPVRMRPERQRAGIQGLRRSGAVA